MNNQEKIDALRPVEVEFRSYYKYTFYFGGSTEDGELVTVAAGGFQDEIYRMEFIPEMTVGELVDEVTCRVKVGDEVVFDAY